MNRSAHISYCGMYRWSLRRQWECSGRHKLWVMLNPSSADGIADDRTLSRCIAFSMRSGDASLTVVNLFAYRTVYSKLMQDAARNGFDIVGHANDAHIEYEASRADTVILAYGDAARHSPDRVKTVLGLLGSVPRYHLGITRSGHPRHPLYVRDDAPFVRC